MAKALVARAQERAAWIGGDHGGPYEDALNTGTVPIAVHIALKEILDHLRSALDYCAHEVCEMTTGSVTNTPIYFPITSRGCKEADFASRVGKLMPGLRQAKPDLVLILAGERSGQKLASERHDGPDHGLGCCCRENEPAQRA